GSPGLKSTTRYGPVPTGLRLAGASRERAPLNGANTCLGMMLLKALGQNGLGFLYPILTVCESSLSMRAMSRYAPLVVAAVAGSMMYSQVNTTSSAVNGLPSCHWTPFFTFTMIESPSRATPPF